jgi:hypothetical protein
MDSAHGDSVTAGQCNPRVRVWHVIEQCASADFHRTPFGIAAAFPPLPPASRILVIHPFRQSKTGHAEDAEVKE